MKFSYVINAIEANEYGDIVNKLRGSKRNGILTMYQDYFDGKQWLVNGPMDQTRFTRSGKEMWDRFDPKTRKVGHKAGDLKTWNLGKLTINTYARYTRGDENDNVSIKVTRNDTPDDALSKESMSLYEDLDEYVQNLVRVMSTMTVFVNKYTSLEFAENTNEPEILKKIRLSPYEELKSIIENVDPREVEPLYWKGNIRGYIRFYMVDKDDAKRMFGFDRKKDVFYSEIWYIDDKGDIVRRVFLNSVEVLDRAITGAYQFLPYSLVVNEKNSFNNFDVDHVEGGEIGDLIDLQDDLNQFLTDLGLVYKNVALPMLKVTEKFLDEAEPEDVEKLKKMFAEVSTHVGRLLVAPVEKMPASGPADSQVSYIQDIFDQFYRETSIPKSVFNSEGLANMAAETLDNLLQSLRVRIGEKRTKVSKILKENVVKHLIHTKKYVDGIEVEVHFPEMFVLSRNFLSTLIIDGLRDGVLPNEYATEKYIDIMGDSENVEKIKGMLLEDNVEFKAEVEKALAQQEINNNRQISGNIQKQVSADNRDNQELATLNG